MKANLYQVGSTHVLAVAEAMTHAECAELKDLVTRAMASGSGKIALDLSEVPFMDSAVLELLLQLSKDCAARGGRLKLVSPSPNCQEILRLTDLRSRFDVQSSVEEATRKA
ncbi:MAG TPA: STAS domain-containing protein [Phycisphaerae bacterium]|nr:STAS domain-containing protein [Phycisphaerae bacterium]HOJ74227.1 STAS domain-containing protein [Phycisphaerae bacterium]HOM51306.1 STAS domain-containing protein [Phycisphaerae bacterium]HON67389.1 STAS domain-containing protein [Phycisphaerae bacterium]HOQ86169.1 STAS domain-containing protein [Phycisphaerae bacterium]